jgi:hypothetical protein
MLIPARPLRVEFVDFQNVDEHREYRFQVSRADEPTEVRLRVAIASFVAGGVRLQDGPDVCYQKLVRTLADVEGAIPPVITIDDADLTSYRVAHTPVSKHRSFTPSTTPAPAGPPKPPRTYARPPFAASRANVAPVVTKAPVPLFGEGQRVRHAVFGDGVTSSSSPGHTVVHFDKDGSKTFVTAQLELDTLSAPHEWETGPRGVNRACRPR